MQKSAMPGLFLGKIGATPGWAAGGRIDLRRFWRQHEIPGQARND